VIRLLLFILIFKPLYLSSGCSIEAYEYFKKITMDTFLTSISWVETRNRHVLNGSVITNYKGCIGENQVHPETAEFITNKLNIGGLDITVLEDNRTLRDLFVTWMMTNYRWELWRVANGYNMGVNSKWFNTNYITTVIGNTNYLRDRVVVRAKRGRVGYLVQFN
jgi:hypothetical protein